MRRGFTLVELSIVLVIVGILMGMVVKGRSLIDTARYIKEISIMRNVEAGFVAYSVDVNETYPIVLTGSSRNLSSLEFINGGYLSVDDLKSGLLVKQIDPPNSAASGSYMFHLQSNNGDLPGGGHGSSNPALNKYVWMKLRVGTPSATDDNNPYDNSFRRGFEWKDYCNLKRRIDFAPLTGHTGKFRTSIDLTTVDFENCLRPPVSTTRTVHSVLMPMDFTARN